MRSRREILRSHYAGLLRGVGVWVSMAALSVSMLLLPTSALAYSEITSRSTTLGSSVPSAVTTYTFTWTTPSSEAGTTKAISFQICTSPLQGSCSAVTGATFVGTSLNSSAPTTSPFTSTWALGGAGNCGVPSTTFACITNSTGSTLSASTSYAVQFTSVTNPSATNSEFYTQISTFTNANGTGSPNDFGGEAVSTSQQLSVTANVQESIVFCTGTTNTASCGSMTGSTVTLSPNPLSTGAPSLGTAYMDCATNGVHGYVITYNGTSFTDTTADTITAAPTTGATLNAGGTEQFGFDLAANSGGNFGTYGANPSGGSGTATSPYGTNNQIAYNTAGAIQVASAAAATANTEYDISYGANVSNTTKAGAYTATQTFIATATY